MSLKRFSILILFLFYQSLLQNVGSSLPLQLTPEDIQPQIWRPRPMPITGTKDGSTLSRLPNAVVPVHYKLDLIPILDPTDTDFLKAPGHVTITVNCTEATNKITLHSNQIEVDFMGVTVTHRTSETNIPVAAQTLDPTQETYTIEVDRDLVVTDEYDIDIPFVARVANDRLDGLYLSTYVDPNTGETNYHAATQFEAIGARKAFPCFDEPDLKATFEIRLGRKAEGFHTLCGTESTGSEPIPDRAGYVWDIYPTTPVRMSTYLLAIVISDFEWEYASEELYRKPVRVWGPKPLMQSTDHGVFAAEVAAKVLSFFEGYLDYPYDFPKMDSVAVPQFAAGAMENWGLNLYSTGLILVTPGETTESSKWGISAVLAHELAHQWWGNLVTLRWWNDIWLNEGFASYMSTIAGISVTPEYEPYKTAIGSLQGALNFDAGPQSTPVHMENEEDVVGAPGTIIYDKGSNLIRMMQGFLTEATLIKGLRNYLKAHAYDNVRQDDLFEQLTLQGHQDSSLPSDMTVKQIMDTWTTQAGYPVLHVSRTGPSIISISQEIFLNDPSLRTEKQESTYWYVPIPYTTKSNPAVNPESLAPKAWLPNNSSTISLEVDSSDEWLFVNPDGKAFYRVLYDAHFSQLLKNQLEADHTLLTPISRTILLDDYFKAAFAEKISINDALSLTTYLENEDELNVWTAVLGNLRKLLTVLTDSDLFSQFNNYLVDKVVAPLERIGAEPVESESPVATMLRAQLLDWTCALDHELCFSTAAKFFFEWMADPTVNPIAVDIQPMMYCSAVARGGVLVQDFLISKYSEASVTAKQRSLFLNSLGCTRDDALIQETLELSLDSDSAITDSDAATLLQRVSENSLGRQAAFAFLQANVDRILSSRVGESGIRSIVSGLSTYFVTQERVTELEEFLEVNTEKFSDSLISSIRASIDTVQANIQWLEIHRPGLEEFFSAQQ